MNISFGDVLLFGLLMVSLFLMFVILLQRGRGGGLAGAFGGLGGQSAFGTKAGDVFTVITVVTVIIWVILACVAGARLRYEASPAFYHPGGAAAQSPVEGAKDSGAERSNQESDKLDSDEPTKNEIESGKKKTPGKSKDKSGASPTLPVESTDGTDGKEKTGPGTDVEKPVGDDEPENKRPEEN